MTGNIVGKYVLVGANPEKCGSLHPGGVITLSKSLLDYAKTAGNNVTVINTARSGFEKVSLSMLVLEGAKRVASLFGLLIRNKHHGVIIFAGAGFSFYERVLMALVCRIFRVPDLFVIVDGHFLANAHAGFLRRVSTSLLLHIPKELAASGGKWQDFFREMGIPDRKVHRLHYWLSADFPIVSTPKKKDPLEPVCFLFVGWMVPAKGIYELIEAIDILSRDERFKISFLGGGTLLEEVREIINRRDWGQHVQALGWVDEETKRDVMSDADVFVLPSHAEGFPMSLIEAFAYGLPSIVTEVGGVSDSLKNGENGYLIAPKNVSELVDAMRSYIHSPEQIERHSREAIDILNVNHHAARNSARYFEILACSDR